MRAGSDADIGRRVYGLGVMALGLYCLAWGTFDPGQPVPRTFPDRTALAYAAGAFLLLAGAAIQARRAAAWAAGALTAYVGLVVVGLMGGRVILAHPAVYGAYSGAAEELALAAAGLIVFAGRAGLDARLAARLTGLGQASFAVCALLFGGAHFVYMDLTAPLVPKWLPLGGEFWGDVTGLAQIAAGLAILSGVRARLAAILLTVMYAAFTALVHLPLLLSDPSRAYSWSENALNLALIGAAWVVAESLGAAAAR